MFAEVAHRERYGTSIYGSHQQSISFDNINNLFHPSIVDASYSHDGHGICGGIKVNGTWNLQGHKDRIVHYDEQNMQILCETFEEEGADWQTVKLTSIHACSILDIFKKMALFKSHVRDYQYVNTEGLHEANAVDAGIMKRETCFVSQDSYNMIYSGPHFFISTPTYKTPRSKCVNKADYDTIDQTKISADFIQRTNYVPIIPLSEYKDMIQGFLIGQDSKGNEKFETWIDYYKIACRKMLNQAGERTLTGCILPPKVSHINGAVSFVFREKADLVECMGLISSTTLDFYLKTIGAQNLNRTRFDSFPMGIDDKYKTALFARTLLLNCITHPYAELWESMWSDLFKVEKWSKIDKRLKKFDTLSECWSWQTPLRNFFERRQALIEIDVISAMALGLSINDLELLYTIQFPVLAQNDEDTWYDAEGNIVFTCSKGLTGVGLDRKRNSKTGMLGWEDIRGEQIDANTYAGTAPTHTHTIDPTKSELYGGQQQTFVAPYTRCDRIADYRTAWAHFDKIFNK